MLRGLRQPRTFQKKKKFFLSCHLFCHLNHPQLYFRAPFFTTTLTLPLQSPTSAPTLRQPAAFLVPMDVYTMLGGGDGGDCGGQKPMVELHWHHVAIASSLIVVNGTCDNVANAVQLQSHEQKCLPLFSSKSPSLTWITLSPLFRYPVHRPRSSSREASVHQRSALHSSIDHHGKNITQV